MEYIGCQAGSRYKNTVQFLSIFVERSGRPIKDLLFCRRQRRTNADEDQNELSLAEAQSSQRKIKDIVDRIRENIILPTLSKHLTVLKFYPQGCAGLPDLPFYPKSGKESIHLC